jgi:hypothetical protein
MKQLLLILFSSLFISCNNYKTNNKIVTFFNDSSLSEINGNPKDSLSFYFPKKLFYDTVRFIVYNGDTIYINSNQNVDSFIVHRKFVKNVVQILDSTNVKDVSSTANFWSFSLFKMDEPILYNFYLNKEMYRLIIGRSLSKFFIIDIIKDKDSIFIITKGLNRQVRYPLIKYAEFSSDFVMHARIPGDLELSQKEIDKIQQNHDSIAKNCNNTNYYVDQLIVKKISKQQWIELQDKLDKIKFWESYPKTCGGCLQIDGSDWILEGHSKFGYQIHEVLSPFREYASKDDYENLFRFIVTTSGLDKGDFNYY